MADVGSRPHHAGPLRSERFQRVERICHDALGYDPSQRLSFLAEACAGDAELLAEVEARLNSSLGHYRIISRIGSGGMGEAYLARFCEGRDANRSRYQHPGREGLGVLFSGW